MINRSTDELPIRSRIEMAHDVAKIIHCLHEGNHKDADFLIENLKDRSIRLDDQIQQDVLIFASQIQFQYAYDPWHTITKDIQQAADQLIFDLGVKWTSSE